MFKRERLTVKEWQRERGASKKRRRRCWRSEASKNHPEEYPGAERLRGACLLRGLVLWTIGCFSLPCPYHYFLRKEGGKVEQEPQAKTPTNPRHRKTDPA